MLLWKDKPVSFGGIGGFVILYFVIGIIKKYLKRNEHIILILYNNYVYYIIIFEIIDFIYIYTHKKSLIKTKFYYFAN